MVQVTELGYMGLGVKSLKDWKDYATKILALEVADEGEPGRCYLRMDYWQHRFILEEDGTDDLNFLGFRVAGQEEFREMYRKLTNAGIEVRIGSDAEAADRRVLEVMKLKDASGFPIEIFHGPQVQFDQAGDTLDQRTLLAQAPQAHTHEGFLHSLPSQHLQNPGAAFATIRQFRAYAEAALCVDCEA